MKSIRDDKSIPSLVVIALLLNVLLPAFVTIASSDLAGKIIICTSEGLIFKSSLEDDKNTDDKVHKGKSAACKICHMTCASTHTGPVNNKIASRINYYYTTAFKETALTQQGKNLHEWKKLRTRSPPNLFA